MSNIEQNLAFILSSRYGEDVRQAIHDAIHDCYEDGKAGATDLVAREQIANLVANAGNTDKDSELVDIRVGSDSRIYESAGEAVRSMFGRQGRLATLGITDLDNCKNMGLYWAFTVDIPDITNLPKGMDKTSGFYLLVFPIWQEASGNLITWMQCIYQSNGKSFIRSLGGSDINVKWHSLGFNFLYQYTSGTVEDYTKLSEFTDSGWYTINKTELLEFSDLPLNAGEFNENVYLFCFSNESTIIQFLFSVNPLKFFWRYLRISENYASEWIDLQPSDKLWYSASNNLLFESSGIYIPFFYNGGMTLTGGYANAKNRLHTNLIKYEEGMVVKTVSGIKFRILYYNSDTVSEESFVNIGNWTTATEHKVANVNKTPYFLLLIGKNDDSEIGIDLTEFYQNIRIENLNNSAFRKFELDGKKVAIIGDSISTNGTSGSYPNVPEIVISEEDVGTELSAYVTYYDVQNGLTLGGHTFVSSEIGTEVSFTPISSDVGKSIGLPLNYNPDSTIVWWEVAMTSLGFEPIPVCWSGSSITSHEKNNDIRKCSWSWHESQIRKCGIRIPGSMNREAPDAILIYRGTNDFSHAPYTKITEDYFDNVDFEYPATDELDSSSYGFKEGYVLLIKKLREAYPNAKIFLCTLNVFKRINYEHFPTNNGLNTLPQYNNVIREIANYMGCGIIEFDKDGITFENCYSEGYITDSPTTPTHPNDKGHAVMGRKAIADILAQWSSME